MTDFRALIADDAFAASFHSLGQYRTALLAALAQPEPQGPPTDEELCKFFRANDDLMRHCEAGTDWDEPLMAEYEFPAVARAVLARWGRPAIEPDPQGPTDEELRELRRFHQWPIGEFLLFTISRAVLARWGRPAIEPVPGVEGVDA